MGGSVKDLGRVLPHAQQLAYQPVERTAHGAGAGRLMRWKSVCPVRRRANYYVGRKRAPMGYGILACPRLCSRHPSGAVHQRFVMSVEDRAQLIRYGLP